MFNNTKHRLICLETNRNQLKTYLETNRNKIKWNFEIGLFNSKNENFNKLSLRDIQKNKKWPKYENIVISILRPFLYYN